MTRVVASDVNETLLDLRALDRPLADLLGSADLRGLWFAQMLQLSFVGGLTGRYVDFGTAQRAAVRMVAERVGRTVTDEGVEAFVGCMSILPAHPEVPEALARLREAPVKVAALTNSTLRVAEAQLTSAGLRHHFDQVLSADDLRALKPAPAPYLAVAECFGVDIAEVRLVAAHSWDVSGALAAGASAAFIARSGMILSPVGPQPDIVAADIADAVEQILVRDEYSGGSPSLSKGLASGRPTGSLSDRISSSYTASSGPRVLARPPSRDISGTRGWGARAG